MAFSCSVGQVDNFFKKTANKSSKVNNLRVVATQPVEFRRGMNGLIALVASALSADPYCGDIFVFRAKRRDRLRCIYWDGSGMILSTKWLDSGTFTFPPVKDGALHMTPEEFGLLVAGLDWTQVQQKPVKHPTKVA